MRLAPAVLSAKPLADCTTAELKQVMEIARMHANRKFKPYLADDFASYVMEDLTKQQFLKYNLTWLWATFLRKELGNGKQQNKSGKVNKKGEAKRQARLYPVDIDKVAPLIKDEGTSPDESDPLNVVLSHFKDRERAILCLYVKWGFTYDEIGHAFGFSRTRAGQIVQALEDKIRIKKLVVPKNNS